MIRAALEGLALFLLPWMLFGVLLLLTRKKVFDWDHWSANAFWLTVAGLSLAIASLVWVGVFGDAHTGRYEPAHLENGQVVPGRVN